MAHQPIKGKLPLLISALILVLALMWLLGRCSKSNENTIAHQYIHPGGDTLVVAIELSPTSYAFTGDSATGFDYEMMKAIARDHRLPVSFHPFAPVQYALDGLRDGRFDVVIANIPASDNLKKDFLLTDNVFVDRQVLVRLKDTDSLDTTPPQLRLLGDTVWVTASSPYKERLSNMSQELGDTIYVMYDPDYSAEHLVLLTALGEIKQAVVNESVAARLAAEYPQIDISTPISLNQFQPWILAKDETVLRDSLNVWIGEFKQTTDYATLIERYFR